jgi:hypothetical protein
MHAPGLREKRGHTLYRLTTLSSPAMKRVYPKTGMARSGFTVTACLFLLTACASTADTDWQTKIGRYSLDDVKREIGQPESCTDLDDGGTVCSWLRRKNQEGIDKLVLTFGTNGKLATSNQVHF